MRSPITCHCLDTANGRPASGVSVSLFQLCGSLHEGNWKLLASGETDSDGRCSQLLPAGSAVTDGFYKMQFRCGDYFKTQHDTKCFFPYADIVFEYEQSGGHYHIPLLLSPYSYTTYRGS